jgi:hypothetical protein
MVRSLTAAALLSLAGSTVAQAPGDLLIVSGVINGTDQLNFFDYSGSSISTLVNFNPSGNDTVARFAHITQGPSGEFYVGNGPLPTQEPSTATISRIDGAFSGLPTVSIFTSSNPLQNPTGLAYDPFTGSLLVPNNPGSGQAIPPGLEGLLAYDITNSANNVLALPEPPVPATPRPRLQAFGGITAGQNPGEFYQVGVNGGLTRDESQPDGTTREPSVIARVQFNDASDPLNNTDEIIFDGSTTFTGLPTIISLIRGIAQLPSGNLVFADETTRSIWEVVLDGSGDFAGINQLVDLSATTTVPQALIYNPFTNKINYSERDTNTLLDDLIEIDLDGTGRNVLATDIRISGLFAVPAPASAALLGLGGLAAFRRRR